MGAHSMRKSLAIILPAAFVCSIAFAQTLPPYLVSQFPAPGASNVPVNVTIALQFQSGATYGALFSLQTTAGGGQVQITPSFYYYQLACLPSSPLKPSTQYTFTVTPLASLGSPYSFTFTTGTNSDLTAPQFLGFNPANGTTGVGLNGPFTALFDKPLLTANVRGVSMRDSSGNTQQSGLALTPDFKGIVIAPQPYGFPAAYEVTVDTSQVTDLFGNAGQASFVTAHYTTFVGAPAVTAGPAILGIFPADGQTALPTNAGIRVLFDRPVDLQSAASAIVLQANGATVSTTVSSFGANQAGIAIKPVNLLNPSQTYSLVVNSNLVDYLGIPVQQPATIQFTTGAMPDLLSPSVSYQYSNGSPVNGEISIRLNKPVMPLGLLQITSFNGPGNPPGVPSLSSDGMTFLFKPVSALAAGAKYTVDLSPLTDFTGTPFPNLQVYVNPALPFDNVAPTILAANPADGSQGVALNSQIQVQFSEVMGAPLSGSYARLSANGVTVPSTASISGATTYSGNPNTLTVIVPSLRPDTAYTLDLSDLTDLAGNPLAPGSIRFTTGSAATQPNTDNLISTAPANGASGVDVNTSIVLTFDSPLSPLDAFYGFQVMDSNFIVYPATATVSGGTLTITPAHPLLDNSVVTVSAYLQDVAGNQASALFKFQTGLSRDSTPLSVTSVSPPDGSTIGTSGWFTLTFNKPVAANTLTNATLSGYSLGVRLLSNLMISADGKAVTAHADSLTQDFTLTADSAIADFGGNPLIPFQAHYTVSIYPQTAAGVPTILAIRPTGNPYVPANTPITWIFATPLDVSAAQSTFVVLCNGAPVAGQFTLSPDNLILTFQANAPYPAGALVETYQSGQQAAAPPFFQIAPATPSGNPSGGLALISQSPGGGQFPSNVVFDFQFSSNVATGQHLVTLSLLYHSAIAVTESIPRPGVLRLTPVTPLAPGNYIVDFAPGIVNASSASVQIIAAAPIWTGNAFTAPASNATDVPVNASISAAFRERINATSITANNLIIQSGGQEIPAITWITDSYQGILLTPLSTLPANARIDVTLTGIEDIFGNAVPDKSWSFQTGSRADFSPPRLISSSTYGNSGAIPVIPPHSAYVMVFDKPIDPQSLGPLSSLGSLGSYVLHTQITDDLRTVSFSADPEYPRGQQISLRLNGVSDISGNGLAIPLPTIYTIAFDADTTPPQLLQLTPSDAQTGLPLNTQIIASFDESINATTAANVQLLKGNTAIPLVQQFTDLRHIRLAPSNPLDPNTKYTLVFGGVADPSGNVMAATLTRTFTTGTHIDLTAPGATVLESGAPNVPVVVTFSKPVSAATVDSQSIVLWQASNAGLSYSNIPVSTNVTLSADGMTATVNARLLDHWRYTLTMGGVMDFAGNAASQINFVGDMFTTGGSYSGPPTPVITPSDGSVGIPLNTPLGVALNRLAVTPSNLSSLFQLTTGGQPVAGTVIFESGSILKFTPALPLLPSTTYRIDFGSITDLGGNMSAPLSSTFTTRADNHILPQFQLVSSSPANGDVGVPVNSPIVLTFNNPVDPAQLNATTVYLSTVIPVTGVYTSSGNTVTFTPIDPWPSASTVSVVFNEGSRFGYYLQDLSGQNLIPYFGPTFKTAAVNDNAPPQLLSETPENGTQLTSSDTAFYLTFSKTVEAPNGSISIYGGSQLIQPNGIAYDNGDFRTLAFSVNIPANSVVSIFSGTQMVDSEGNSVVPFTLQYPTGLLETLDAPAVVSMSPGNVSSGVAPNTPIQLEFNKTMDPATLVPAVRVTQDGENLDGTVAVTDNNWGVLFTPAAPYNAGSRIDVFVLETASDPSGLTITQRYDGFFMVAAAGTSPGIVTQTGFAKIVAPGAALELAFDRPLDPATLTNDNIWLRAGRKSIPGKVQPRGDRVLRFIPADALTSGVEYVLTVGAGVRLLDGNRVQPAEFSFTAASEPPGPASVDLAEITTLRGKPAMHLHFTRPVSPLSIDGILLRDAKGSPIPLALRRIDTSFHEVWLVPQQSGVDLTQATVVIDNVEDRAGWRLARTLHRPGRAQ
jgi:methionine-rich copper-binding protein CopC